ncbi:MAG: ScpA family protein [Minisyncoccia bacterium]
MPTEQDKLFKIKQESFEGPLDLLLSLIEKRKLFINDISLSKVADDYVAYVREIGNFSIADSANFILIASTLILIKSKSLLPQLNLTEEEQADVSDLERRLKIYQRMKELSVHIKEKFGEKIIFAPLTRKSEPVFSPDETMTIVNLIGAMREVIKNLPKKEKLPQLVVKKVISLEETIENLTKRIQSSFKMSFNDFAKNQKEKVNIIVSFLAMLELVKEGIINVRQERHFEDIQMESGKVQVPHYN